MSIDINIPLITFCISVVGLLFKIAYDFSEIKHWMKSSGEVIKEHESAIESHDDAIIKVSNDVDKIGMKVNRNSEDIKDLQEFTGIKKRRNRNEDR